MFKKPYIYRGLEASLYDILDELAEFDDYDFYRWLIENRSGSVLDIGCGTGRILAPLLEEGIDAYGLDASEEMLRLCRDKIGEENADRLFAGDMRDFNLGCRFATIMVPGFSLQMLERAEDLKSCLKKCREHLEPGGQLVLSFYIPLEFLEGTAREGEMEERKRVSVGEAGEAVVAYQAWTLNEADRTMTLYNRFTRQGADGEVLSEDRAEMSLRWYSEATVRELLKSVGFAAVEAFSDFTFEVYDEASECLCIVAKVE